jgi:heme-degrading monooxygenase HmoA
MKNLSVINCNKQMITRIWHGWTTPENDPVYESLLIKEIFPAIENKKVAGFKKITLLKQVRDEETEFITIMLFDDLTAVKEFAGEDYGRSWVPDKARRVLKRFDGAAEHYEVRHELNY